MIPPCCSLNTAGASLWLYKPRRVWDEGQGTEIQRIGFIVRCLVWHWGERSSPRIRRTWVWVHGGLEWAALPSPTFGDLMPVR